MPRIIMSIEDCDAPFILESDEKFRVPTCAFRDEVDAELALAVANVLHKRGKSMIGFDTYLKFIFRILGIQNGWEE